MIALCIATRGRPESLKAVVKNAREGARLPDTKIVVGFDSDDEAAAHTGEHEVFADREDSVGAKYNRIFSRVDADVYIIGVDDLLMSEGWDAEIAKANTFPDGFGAIYFGRNVSTSGSLPAAMAITRGFWESIGALPEQFPFWWYDTWVYEIGAMTGRVAWADVNVQLVNGRGKSRGCRDIAFWQNLFDQLRPWRIAVAGKAIANMIEADSNKGLLFHQLGAVSKALHQMGSNLRDPIEAQIVGMQQGTDAPADERYLRIKRKAEDWLARRA